MTRKEIREWYERQVEWYKKEIEWHNHEIEYLTRELERCRRKDRELTEYVWSKGVLTETEMKIWGHDKYESDETHKNLLKRRREYLKRKRSYKQLAKYEKWLEEA